MPSLRKSNSLQAWGKGELTTKSDIKNNIQVGGLAFRTSTGYNTTKRVDTGAPSSVAKKTTSDYPAYRPSVQ
jgi:hypothetical protein